MGRLNASLRIPQGVRVAAAALAVWGAAACTADVDNVFGRPIDNSDDGGGGSGGATTSVVADGGATTVSNGGDPQTNTTDGPPDTSTDTTDVTTDSTTDGMDTVTTTGRPTGPAVDCGVVDNGGAPQCEIVGDGSCCWNKQGNGFECVDSAGECPVGFTNELVSIQCQTNEDCGPNLICCAHREYVSGQAPYDRTSCEDSCQYPNLYLCDIQADECPEYNNGGQIIQSVCKQSTLLPAGYYVCGFNN